jgi:hypothetical protein
MNEFRPGRLTIFTEEQSFFWVVYKLLSHPVSWLILLLSAVTALIPDICLKVAENFYHTIQEEKLRIKLSLNDRKDSYIRGVPNKLEEQKRKRLSNIHTKF